ncbi:hypothetical protein GOP47_0006896 [Adiantum capillus-veneris]|uniref:Uncharacterized protein n=1 Tax=Adiantum capillus-veneris TaxID=13818 RepID=A0A9D4ZNG3_ADICA|nr:hypothetical protein GOP47_0006896 [Adiantum capillus-veneris]
MSLIFMSWILSNPASRLETLSSLSWWVRILRRKHLVFIVDHIDKMDQADVLQLVSWATTEADQKDILVILVASEQSSRLLSNNDTSIRAKLVQYYPPSPQETREALRKFISTHPDMHHLDVEECLYLQGTHTTEYRNDKLCNKEMDLTKEFASKHARFENQDMDFNDVGFWYMLLVAGV